MLEQWSDSSEMQRAVELYQDLIKCCCGDAVGEVRSTARMCYRAFARCWPERARHLFHTLDPNIQRLITEEDRGFHKSFPSLGIQDRISFQQQQLQHSSGTHIPTQPMTGGGSPMTFYENSIKTTNDRSMSLLAGGGSANASSLLSKSMDVTPDRSLESMLQASQQQVNAIETLLRGSDMSDKGTVSTAIHTAERDPVGGSYRKMHANNAVRAEYLAIDPPSARDPAHPASAPVSNQSNLQGIALPGANSSGFPRSNSSGTLTALSALGALDRVGLSSSMNRETRGEATFGVDWDVPRVSSEQTMKRISVNAERPHQRTAYGEHGDVKGAKRTTQLEAYSEKLVGENLSFNSVPAYQRPLLRQSGSGRSSSTGRISNEETQLLAGINPYGEANSLMTLNDALSEGLSPSADWSARVAAFTYLKKLLQQGSKGLQDVTQSFDKVMKLFFEHLDDPHHKVAQAALSTMAELVPACRKPFEAYLERILPHVFARLVDAKEMIRELASSALETVGNTYSIDILLPSLLRSLDEQRSPKAKISVIEFAIAAFAKLALNSEAPGGSGLLKLWLAKLAPLTNEKNPKLKQIAITGLISLYSHFDSTTVLNFILGLPIEEQSTLRRTLKQHTPRIEVDLMTYLQQRAQRMRVKSGYDQGDGPSTPVEGNGAGTLGRNFSALAGNDQQVTLGYSTMSLNSSDGDQKWGATGQADSSYLGLLEAGQAPSSNSHENSYGSPEQARTPGELLAYTKSQSIGNIAQSSPSMSTQGSDKAQSTPGVAVSHEHTYSGGLPLVDAHSLVSLEQKLGTVTTSDPKHLDEGPLEMLNSKSPFQSANSSVPNLLHQMSNRGNGKPAEEKQEALKQLILLSGANDSSTWPQVCQFFHPQHP
jgi:CLIP-associating protein 1/2